MLNENCYSPAAKGRRMGSGGLRGLQNRCFGAEASKGRFDSDTPPPVPAAQPVGTLGCWEVGRPMLGVWDVLTSQRPNSYGFGASVRKPLLLAPPPSPASI